MKFTVGQVGQIARGLMDGFGAEDIALQMRVHPDLVRMQIRKFRAIGNLATIIIEARHRQVVELRRRGIS